MTRLGKERDSDLRPVHTIAFVDGPRAGEREADDGRRDEISAPGGVYERSVRCADDGDLRYVWRPQLVAHG